jgi:hypothetical protein
MFLQRKRKTELAVMGRSYGKCLENPLIYKLLKLVVVGGVWKKGEGFDHKPDI